MNNAWKLLKKAPPTAIFGMVVIVTYLVLGIFADLIAPYGESEIVGEEYLPSTAEFLLGTDNLGRDILSRLIFGARNTVGIALFATAFAFFAGTFFGLFAATLGGWVDQLLGRIADVMMSIPTLVFGLLLLTIFGTGVVTIIMVIGFLYSANVFRLVRAVAMNVVALDFIEVAKLRGEGLLYIIRKEVLPNILPPLVAEFGLRFCFVFLFIAALSFLGLGLQPPTADWGSMVKDSAGLIIYREYVALYAAGAIALLTVAVNFVVDWFLHITSGLKD